MATYEIRPTGKTALVWDLTIPTMRERIAKGKIETPLYGIYHVAEDRIMRGGFLLDEAEKAMAEYTEYGYFKSWAAAHRDLMRLSDSLYHSNR